MNTQDLIALAKLHGAIVKRHESVSFTPFQLEHFCAALSATQPNTAGGEFFKQATAFAKADERGSAEPVERDWVAFCRPFVYMNGSHEMPNYPAICRAVLALATAPAPAGSAEPGELPPACRSIGGCALATAPARAGSEPGMREALERLRTDGHTIFEGMTDPSYIRDAIEWYAASVSAILDRASTPEQPAQAEPGLTDQEIQQLWLDFDDVSISDTDSATRFARVILAAGAKK